MMVTGMPVVTLALSAAMALINIWLGVRVTQVRARHDIFVGDGGNEAVVRRVRAHTNFAENGWVVVALVLAIELAIGASPWLWAAAALFVVARVAHAIGMDGLRPARATGAIGTLVIQLALAIWAIALPLVAVRGAPPPPTIETTVPQG